MKNTIVEVVDTNTPIEEIIQPVNGKDEVVLHFPKDATGNVTVTINGKNYTSNVVDGFAVVEIDDLPNGNYQATVHYSGDANYSQMTQSMNVTVKNSKVNPVTKILSNSDVSAVYSGKATYKFLVKKVLKIKFNKKTYKVKTNKKGVAKWKVKKSMLKKLKVGKKVKYTVTYGKATMTKKLTIKK